MANFPLHTVPDKLTISHLMCRFHETGAVADCKHSGHPLVSDDDTLHTIHQSMLCSPHKSLGNFLNKLHFLSMLFEQLQNDSSYANIEFKSCKTLENRL